MIKIKTNFSWMKTEAYTSYQPHPGEEGNVSGLCFYSCTFCWKSVVCIGLSTRIRALETTTCRRFVVLSPLYGNFVLEVDLFSKFLVL